MVVVLLSKQHLRITIQTACRILGLMWISIYAPLHPPTPSARTHIHAHTHTRTHTHTYTHTHACNTRSQRKRTSGRFPSKTFVSSTSSAQVPRGPCLSVSIAARRLPSRRSKTLTTPTRSDSSGSSVTPTSSNSSKPCSLLAFHICPVGWVGNCGHTYCSSR